MTQLQRQSVVLAAMLMAVLASVLVRAETTSVNNGSNSATITQSGDPSRTEKQVKTAPGYTSIEQHNGGSSATIIQRSNGGPPLTDADVYRRIRKGASPQSQQTLDNLMRALGLQMKM